MSFLRVLLDALRMRREQRCEPVSRILRAAPSFPQNQHPATVTYVTNLTTGTFCCFLHVLPADHSVARSGTSRRTKAEASHQAARIQSSGIHRENFSAGSVGRRRRDHNPPIARPWW